MGTLLRYAINRSWWPNHCDICGI